MSACRDCGNSIVWGKTKNGKSVPLDPNAIVYKLVRDVDHIANRMETWADAIPGAMVSHLSTCQKKKHLGSSGR